MNALHPQHQYCLSILTGATLGVAVFLTLTGVLALDQGFANVWGDAPFASAAGLIWVASSVFGVLLSIVGSVSVVCARSPCFAVGYAITTMLWAAMMLFLLVLLHTSVGIAKLGRAPYGLPEDAGALLSA